MKNLQLVFTEAKKTLQKKQTYGMTYMKPSPPKRGFGSMEDDKHLCMSEAGYHISDPHL